MTRADYLCLALICASAFVWKFDTLGEAIIVGDWYRGLTSIIALTISGIYFVKTIRKTVE